MFCVLKKKKAYPAYVSEHNSNREKHVILLMISNVDTREQLETSEGCEVKSTGRQR